MTIRILDHSTVALSGMNLIEASAGTGKTWAITSLYLRLLLEKELRPEQILVVTYTEAATMELHARIRRRIRQALDAMRGDPTDDPFLIDLCDRAAQAGMEERAALLLEAALAEFDTASIFTIHGFCNRALQDHAFESGALYDTELVTDQSAIAREVIDDFWRERFFGSADRLLGYALLKGWSPDVFMAFLKSLQLSGRDEVIPVYGEAEIARIGHEAEAAFDEVRRIWSEEKEPVSTLLRTGKGLSRSEKAYRADRVEQLLSDMEVFVAAGNPFGLFDGFDKLTASGIAAGTKSSGTPPSHQLFDACERLQSAADERLLALKSEVIAFYRQRLPERKKERNIRFFDDLLADLYQALQGGHEATAIIEGGHEAAAIIESGYEFAATPGGLEAAALAEALRNRYRAALIDEFQDTDPVQYDIFRRIYAGSEAPLFLIGDPKQAIYSFRGADIFAYLQAASDVGRERSFTLNTNWRSVPKLLDGFNLLFDSARHPFVFDNIPSPPLVAGNAVLRDAESPVPPLEICLLRSGDGDGSLKSGESEWFAAGACASMVTETINGGSDAGDIAVIVRTHRQARMMQAALRECGIVSVMRSDESVFASVEAEEVRILVTALAEPGRESLVRAALVTPLFGLNGSDIARLNDDENAWVERLQQFREYHRLWQVRGFMVMVRELMRREAVRERLLARSGSSGERALTNVLHCFELLHREAHSRGLGMEGLVTWFGERVAAREPGEEYQIRLESDEPAVRIVTAHVSKGLQYPIVFCSFQFGGAGSGGDVVLFHDDDGRMKRDFGSREIEHHRALASRESLAENLRLFYVALTRAERRCIFFTARIVDGRQSGRTPMLSPSSYLLYVSDEARQSPRLIGEAQHELAALDAGAMAERLQSMSDDSGGAIRLRRLSLEDDLTVPLIRTAAADSPSFVIREFTASVETDWRIASFTTLSRHRHMAFELPDRDESTPEQQAAAAPAVLPDTDRSIFAFPKGAGAGILIHSIFETLDFAQAIDDTSESYIEEASGRALDRYGYDRHWQPCLTGMVRQVLSTPLASPEGSFTLGGLRPGSWSTELEFFFPLRRITFSRLSELLMRHGVIPNGADPATTLQALDFTPVKGMLMGFMDMVFEAKGRYYLLDWKSNHLGNAVEAYHRDHLGKAMQDNLYRLQYLLYTVALDRFLSLRVPGYRYDTHFGGAIYVFLRGVSAERGEEYGFFRDLPSEALIRELQELLIETETGEDEI
ncbi:MAG: UvrD-helicase domain-containing protein [Chlorobium sp.]|uniref:UvrD-helicase domain-containing protein n=1 Tax=Chlorobium sp. TaxID=1095 RepID=UPI0025B92F44|nr:UvrD-helicase domain-containing protein [Chlorobium sp.]MCF8216645.1 UvrD-helicase domain-containing protein [Chlorobium sp.]MCF8271515.1 UvrD-helicase domain-containing protein [Chlorobium sp.]MCF8287887.1 UvrD-helicase domain-containing protein [Chlorobium sp.]MCF8291461.1 UvrD-helicase domain-containing protein [Chlorobium sp.]MCF8385556.1 UvrD-helicase domain-containing protein [Chlorobium sp.]